MGILVGATRERGLSHDWVPVGGGRRAHLSVTQPPAGHLTCRAPSFLSSTPLRRSCSTPQCTTLGCEAPFRVHRYVPKSTPDSHQAEAMSRVSYCLQTYNSCELLCRSHQDASRTSCFNRDLNLAQTFFQTENPALYTCEYPLKL